MLEEQFWQLVTTATPLASSKEIADELTAKLEPLSNQELANFDKFFQQKMRLSFTWDLWGAAFVIAGCDSEYAFAEFRSWLISRGQKIFETSLKNPDKLTDFDVIPETNQLAYPYLDEYDLIAGFIFEQRNGEELLFVPSGQASPKGKRFKNKSKLLKAQYPKLFARYWRS